ncbi:MAG: GNAT family N-acetyltransferase [Acidimicrobiales bacterium]
MSVAIRPPLADELPALRMIERLAGERFRDVGLPEVADDEPPSLDVLARYAGGGRCWVAVDEAGGPIGYVLVDSVDGNAHVEQLSVHPTHQGAGLGRALMERVSAWARETGMPAVTLTTFSDVPWNAPLYRHLGFRVLREDELGPGLRAVRDDETIHGLDPARRVCMRLELPR